MKSVLALTLSLLAVSCGPQPAPPDQTAGPSAGITVAGDAGHELGRRVYNFRCYFCHGYSGDAATVAASLLEPRPRNFKASSAAELAPERIAAAVREGRPGTAMKGFSSILSDAEMRAVTEFVFREFVTGKKANSRYHSAANGWPDHDRYRAAFPFATGEIAPDIPYEQLSAEAAVGKRLYMGACVSCHDHGSGPVDRVGFALRSVSYPPFNYTKESAGEEHHENTDPDDPYERHEKAPVVANLREHERRGEKIFQGNCAYCHASDGTGRNWIGAFIDPPPPDFNKPEVKLRLTSAHLREVIRAGIPGTSMPAWASVLRRAEIEDVVAYMRRAFEPVAPSRPVAAAPAR